jgi:hypothetical protein
LVDVEKHLLLHVTEVAFPDVTKEKVISVPITDEVDTKVEKANESGVELSLIPLEKELAATANP